MPLYRFTCRQCGHEYRELVSRGGHAPCPQCGSVETERTLSAPTSIFNGQGFYKGRKKEANHETKREATTDD